MGKNFPPPPPSYSYCCCCPLWSLSLSLHFIILAIFLFIGRYLCPPPPLLPPSLFDHLTHTHTQEGERRSLLPRLSIQYTSCVVLYSGLLKSGREGRSCLLLLLFLLLFLLCFLLLLFSPGGQKVVGFWLGRMLQFTSFTNFCPPLPPPSLSPLSFQRRKLNE